MNFPIPLPVPPGPALAGLGASLLLLAGLLERSLRRALAERSAPEGWFGFALRVQWTSLAVLVTWPFAAWRLANAGWRPTGDASWDAMAAAAVSIVPAFAFAAWAQWRMHEGMRRLRDLPWSAAECFERAAWPWLGVGACLLGLLMAPGAMRGASLAHVAPIAACALVAAIAARSSRRFRPAPESVTAGELRDRLFALAERAGVRLEQLYVVPMARLRLANAFAVQGRAVVLTDYLLDHLDRAEVDAVLAHELAHHRMGHPGKLAAALLGVGGLVALGLWSPAPAVFAPLALLAGLLGFFALSRRFEYAADAGAVALGATPEALVSGLASLGRLNQVPDRWGRGLELWLTHPSLERRRQALERSGARAPAPAVTVVEAVAPASAPAARYVLPEIARPGARVFATALKQAILRRAAFTVLTLFALVPAVWFAAARAGAWPLPGVVLWATGVALAALAGVLATNALGRLPHARLRREFVARHGAAADGAWFVGYAPGGATRVIEGFYAWDIGFLAIERGRLVYRGELASFALAPDDLAAVTLVAGPPAWQRTLVVRLEWDDTGGRTQALQLFPLAPAPRGGYAGACRAMHEAIEAWRSQPSTADARVLPPEPPRHVEVTGLSPNEAAHPKRMVPVATVQAVLAALAFGVTLPFGAPASGIFEVWLASVAAYAILLVPMWRHREPARDARRTAPSRTAA